MPKPGFPLCSTICQNLGVDVKYYSLRADSEWEVDLSNLELLIDSKTAAIVVNNPSNPCGSVFSRAHMIEILNVASHAKVPIIADEVYYGMAYDKTTTFIPFGHLTGEDVPEVPIISVCALSKIYCVPGWRLGWLIFHDRHGYFKSVKEGALRAS